MKTKLKTSFLWIFLFLISVSMLHAQEKEKGKLADFEEEVEKGSNSNDRDNNESSDLGDYDSYDDDCDGISSDIEGCIFMARFAGSLLNGARILLFISDEEIEKKSWKIGYSNFPYSDHSDGLYDKSSLKKYSVHTNFNYFRESDKLTAFNFNARLSPAPAVSFEINYSDFKEELRTRYDHLRMYDIFVNYNRFKLENFTLWWGLGYKGFIGDRSHGGFAINLGTNIFLPNTPVSFGINYNAGFIESTTVQDFSPKIRYHLNRAEISLGYRTYNAGNVSINGWTLGFGFYL